MHPFRVASASALVADGSMTMIANRFLDIKLSLAESRVWRRLLFAVFVLGFLCRTFVQMELQSTPVGLLYDSPGTEPWYFATLGQEVARTGDWTIQRQNLLVSREMQQLATPTEWAELGGNRLPRGALAVYLLALGYVSGGGILLFQAVSAVVGGVLAVVLAMLAARVFRDRRVGVIAGIVAASHQALVVPALLPTPTLLEAFCFSSILLGIYLVREPGRAGWGWIAMAGGIAAGIWLRPFFLWGLVLLPVALFTTPVRSGLAWLAGGLVVLALSIGLLAARNNAAGASPMPLVGNPGWEFARTVHPNALLEEEVLPDLLLYRAGQGNFTGVLRLTLGSPAHRAAIPHTISHKLRQFLGARDTAGTINFDYIRRRSEMLRLTTLATDTTMAAMWAALVFLLLRRRMPLVPLAALTLVIANALFGSTTGAERTMLHALGCVLIAGGLVCAWDARLRNPAGPLLFIGLWAASHLFLQIDDQARGSRFREVDFVRSALIYRRLPEGSRGFDREREDYKNLRNTERVLRQFWAEER